MSENIETQYNEDDYKSRTGQSEIPVQSDDAKIDNELNADVEDSDEQLVRDDNDAIDRGNIIGERTRHAAKPAGTYQEPGDEENLPGAEDGTSTLAK